MTKDEALKQADESLVDKWYPLQEPVKQECDNCGGTGDVSGEYPGVACGMCNGTGKAQPVKQEPVAYGVEGIVDGNWVLQFPLYATEREAELAMQSYDPRHALRVKALYGEQQMRKWVDLTEPQIKAAVKKGLKSQSKYDAELFKLTYTQIEPFIAVIAAFKEKNK